MSLFSLLTFTTPTNSNLKLTNPLTTVICEPALYRLFTSHIPNLVSIFHCLGRAQGSVQVRGLVKRFGTLYVFSVRIARTWHNLLIWRTTSWRLSPTTYSICSQLPFISGRRSYIPSQTMLCAVVTGTHLLWHDIWKIKSILAWPWCYCDSWVSLC